jgi:hypothetical protein
MLDHWSKCPRKICPVCQPIKMAIQGQEGSGIPDYLNLSAHAQTINAQASLANKIEFVNPQILTRVFCPTCKGKFTVDQLKLHMPTCQGHTQTTDAQSGHAQTGHTQTGHTQTIDVQLGHPQTSNAQTGHTQPQTFTTRDNILENESGASLSQEPVRSVEPNTSQPPAIPSTSYNLSGHAQTGNYQAGHTPTGNAQTPAIPSTSFNLSGHAQASNAQAGHTQTGNAEVPATLSTSFNDSWKNGVRIPPFSIDVSFSLLFFKCDNSLRTVTSR